MTIFHYSNGLVVALLLFSNTFQSSSAFSFSRPLILRAEGLRFSTTSPVQEETLNGDFVVNGFENTKPASLTLLEDAEANPAIITKDPSKEIAHHQKKLKYWKRQQKEKENAYKRYLQQQVIDHKTTPIYKREGKIDHYTLRPVFDQETERIQTEIWSIKENIKLTYARIHEEEHVQQVLKATEEKLAHHDAEIKHLQEEAQKKQEEIRRQAEATRKALEEQKEQIRLKAEATRKALEESSSKRLAQKEQEIDSLSKEINDLVRTLQDKRNELNTKECLLSSLETELQTKEAVLGTLKKERASLRSLLKRSWRVIKTRFMRRVLHKDDAADDDIDIVVIGETNNANNKNVKAGDAVLVASP